MARIETATINYQQHQQPADLFVDASEVVANEADFGEGRAAGCRLQGKQAKQQDHGRQDSAERSSSDDSSTGAEEETELRVRLEETKEILRMALSNQFVKAIDLCGQR